MRFLLFLFFSYTTLAQKQELFLNQNWGFSKNGESSVYPATVPGNIFTDLLDNELIEDPYQENNEQKLQWVEQEDWIYKQTFSLTSKQLSFENIHLCFEGLDTYADVFVNEKKVFFADNMFRTWEFEIKNFLKTGENTIKVHFKSPIKQALKRYEDHFVKLPSGCETKEPRTASFTRKAAYQYGWDWGPRFVGCGIWRPVKLIFWNKAIIKDVKINTQILPKKNNVESAAVYTYVKIEGEIGEKYYVQIDKKKHPHIQKSKLDTFVNINFIKKAKKWYCNGEGKQPIYTQSIYVLKNDTVLDSKKTTFGLRNIELIQQKDSIGSSFYFLLNKKPVFIKGANYIPQDIFPSRVKKSQYKKLLKKVRKAGINMLRVWGGGIYECDYFYDLCDRMGIMVWQDFMFAGSLYPNDLFPSIEKEVRDNVTRLQNHPCIALWCGNNEIEVAWKNWGWQKQYHYSKLDSAKLWGDYRHLFEHLIPNTLRETAPLSSYNTGINYVSTSPLSNWGKSENFNHGSMHYWGVWHGKDSFEDFDKNVGRFMVEYGFQSFPNYGSLKKTCADTSLYLNSETMKNRQKSYVGNKLISKNIQKYFKEPKKFKYYIKLSQKTQEMALKKAISSHLSKQPHCMGTMFWQLNDCWPGPSWSVIDYYGKNKKAYRTIKRLFKKQ